MFCTDYSYRTTSCISLDVGNDIGVQLSSLTMTMGYVKRYTKYSAVL